MSTPPLGFKVRQVGGKHHVVMFRLDGTEIPSDKQPSVYSHVSRDRAQVVSDTLNNGLVQKIIDEAKAVRKAWADA